MRIAIDIDSTLHHYWDEFARVAKRRFGVSLPYDQQLTWEIDQLRPRQVAACIAETHCDEAIAAARPYDGAVDTVRRWHEAGHEIYVMSHRREDSHEATAAWLDQIGLPCDGLFCAYEKVARCEAMGIDLLIDDSPVNLAAALEAGIEVATIAHPWNRELCELEGVLCAADWSALERRLAPLLSVAVAR